MKLNVKIHLRKGTSVERSAQTELSPPQSLRTKGEFPKMILASIILFARLLTFQTRKVVGLRIDCTDREFSRQCVEDAMYANKHNQTIGQRWLERRRKRRQWRYNEVRRRCTMTTEERRSVKAEGLVDGFPTRNRLQGSR